ncbi:hypothetical protein J4N45_10525 [Vibrio sp. SCSIO 43140]|uniref:BRCT domain-containing protein n=1 Tax=Vibrio sp. SCSIO 43140 TaxID=2819100 RepID=UPI0020754929|nr:BRCT domain-containing protein [Vibrio sp. SCSIO 43140]USD58965.1 hypothetical protein J4N45_10525 [Vibrio sp. SCSIO 43140]
MKELLLKEVATLSNAELGALCTHLNVQYRQGEPMVSDECFDQVYMPALAQRLPDHPLIVSPQSTLQGSKGRVAHPSPMLSTEKAYTEDEVKAFVARCEKAARELSVDPTTLQYRVMAKLDGIAGRYNAAEQQLVTRGDGAFGNCISHLLQDGLVIQGNDSENGVGEVVMPTEYFERHLSEHFAHPRNFVSGVASSDNYSEFARQALTDGAIHFVLYRDMPHVVVDGPQLVGSLQELVAEIKSTTVYPIDGTVIEVMGDELRASMGHTSHHHLWQVAKKEVGETKDVLVTGIDWQVGRSGRVTPVILIEPTELSGAVISKVSGHHAAYVRDHGIGIGATIQIVRSGEVIPTHRNTTSPVEAQLPSHCPCCHEPLSWKQTSQNQSQTFLVCENLHCEAQSESAIRHFFRTIQCDLFGEKSVSKLVEAGYTHAEHILTMDKQDFINAGFGAGQSKNFVDEIARVRREPLADNLLLGALGISKLGRSASAKILAHYKITDLDGISAEQIEAIDGFGSITSVSIAKALKERAAQLTHLLSLNFNLTHQQDSAADGTGSLSGIHIVFTGSMSGSRDEMKADAKSKGANVQSSVNGKTQILCCGEKVGQKKLDAATAKGVEIISEAEYWERFAA